MSTFTGPSGRPGARPGNRWRRRRQAAPRTRPTGRNRTSPTATSPAAPATMASRPKRYTATSSPNATTAPINPSSVPSSTNGTADVGQRRAHQLHDLDLRPARVQRQSHDPGDGQARRQRQHRRQGKPGGARRADKREKPLDPAPVVAHVAHARLLTQLRGQPVDCRIAGQLRSAVALHRKAAAGWPTTTRPPRRDRETGGRSDAGPPRPARRSGRRPGRCCRACARSPRARPGVAPSARNTENSAAALQRSSRLLAEAPASNSSPSTNRLALAVSTAISDAPRRRHMLRHASPIA